MIGGSWNYRPETERSRVHIVNTKFRRLDEVTLADIYDEIGVYVIWNAHSEFRPSYIGEGEVLKRFACHLGTSWARRPLGGLIWLNDSGHTRKEQKWECELVECALLALGDYVDRGAIHNQSRGKAASLSHLLHRFGERTVRVNVTGYDPLFPPERPRLSKMKTFKVLEDGKLDQDDWRSRSI